MAKPERAVAQHSLASALACGHSEVVSLVGAGGKTSALRLLAKELTSASDRVIATTTTAMLFRELASIGPLVMDASDNVLVAELRETLRGERAVGVARSLGANGKVVGLPPATIDRLWADGLADKVVVEADGSRGMPLKAFGPHEPQVPSATGTIVLMAGLDAIGRPFTAEHVHRADVLADTLGMPLGGTVTSRIFVSAVRDQVARLRQRWPASRIVALLNKADSRNEEALGLQLADDLIGNHDTANCSCPDAVIVASLHSGRVARVVAAK